MWRSWKLELVLSCVVAHALCLCGKTVTLLWLSVEVGILNFTHRSVISALPPHKGHFASLEDLLQGYVFPAQRLEHAEIKFWDRGVKIRCFGKICE